MKVFAVKILAKIYPPHVLSTLLLAKRYHQNMEPTNDGTLKMISSVEYIFMMQNELNKGLSGRMICIFDASPFLAGILLF